MEKAYQLKYYVIITPFVPTDSKFQGPFIYDLVRAIEKSGKYKGVLVFKPKSNHDKKSFYTYQGIKVHLFKMVNLPSYIFNGSLNWLNAKLFIRALKKSKIKADEIAVAHGHTSSFGALCLALKRFNNNITTILHHHDPDPFTIRNGRYASNLLNLYIRASINIKLFENIDLHIAISNYVKDNLLAFPLCADYEMFPSYLKQIRLLSKLHLPKCRIKNTYVLYNGVDLEKFHPAHKDINRNDFVIGCVANFVDWKNQITILKALNILVKQKQITNLKVLFVGSGPELKNCIDYVSENNLIKQVDFLSEVDHSCLPSFYHHLDLFVLPSYFEGFGCVYTEAYACGVPFMCCEHQGAAECIKPSERDKWQFPPHNYNALAGLIERQYKERNTQHLCKDYDINILVGRYLATIEKL